MKKKYHVWECKIVVDGDEELPSNFDFIPRQASIYAVEDYGINVRECFSGWGGKLTRSEKQIVDK